MSNPRVVKGSSAIAAEEPSAFARSAHNVKTYLHDNFIDEKYLIPTVFFF